jgi:hypothetical protein
MRILYGVQETVTREVNMKTTIDSRVFGEVVVALKFSDNSSAENYGRSYYAVIDGKTHFPKKADGVTNEASARAWLNLLCRSKGILRK